MAIFIRNIPYINSIQFGYEYYILFMYMNMNIWEIQGILAEY